MITANRKMKFISSESQNNIYHFLENRFLYNNFLKSCDFSKIIRFPVFSTDVKWLKMSKCRILLWYIGKQYSFQLPFKWKEAETRYIIFLKTVFSDEDFLKSYDFSKFIILTVFLTWRQMTENEQMTSVENTANRMNFKKS